MSPVATSGSGRVATRRSVGLATDGRFKTNEDLAEHMDELESVLGPIFEERTTDE
ncbi:hypothetical protein [Saliphagus sp. LR7]|uniref:hypothetical protein n=1 Tax=Saliphagus sp. LR7 TaxID=2282654 RepID=UPI001300AC9F|nr:hypothetical protein [Saliphagus sp. LR7]